MRASWVKYFLQIAKDVSSRSTCLRRNVGCVAVKDKRLLTTGYNGAPSNCLHCGDVGCIRQKMNIPSGERHELCRAIHAEQNAIIQAAFHGISLNGSIMYVTHHPCFICAKMIINAGIKEIYYIDGYPDELAKEILNEAGIFIFREVEELG